MPVLDEAVEYRKRVLERLARVELLALTEGNHASTIVIGERNCSGSMASFASTTVDMVRDFGRVIEQARSSESI